MAWAAPAFFIPFLLSVSPAVESLHSLNDQISHFIVNKSKTLDEDEDAFLPSEKESLKSAMMLMRHLLMDAQVQNQCTPICYNNKNAFLRPRGSSSFVGMVLAVQCSPWDVFKTDLGFQNTQLQQGHLSAGSSFWWASVKFRIGDWYTCGWESSVSPSKRKSFCHYASVLMPLLDVPDTQLSCRFSLAPKCQLKVRKFCADVASCLCCFYTKSLPL